VVVRRGHQAARRRVGRELGDEGGDARQQVVSGDADTLGRAGGARGVHEQGEVVAGGLLPGVGRSLREQQLLVAQLARRRIARCRVAWRRVADGQHRARTGDGTGREAGQDLPGSDQDLRLRVVEYCPQLRPGQPEVERGHDRAELGRGEHGLPELGGVLVQIGDPVTAGDTEPGQGPSEPAGALIELCEGDLAPVARYGYCRRPRRGLYPDHLGDRRRRCCHGLTGRCSWSAPAAAWSSRARSAPGPGRSGRARPRP